MLSSYEKQVVEVDLRPKGTIISTLLHLSRKCRAQALQVQTLKGNPAKFHCSPSFQKNTVNMNMRSEERP